MYKNIFRRGYELNVISIKEAIKGFDIDFDKFGSAIGSQVTGMRFRVK